MFKSLVLVVLLMISFVSFGRMHLRNLKKVKSFELVVEQGAVFAGADFSVFLKIELKNGSVHYSNLNKGVGFNDFEVTVKGAQQNVPNVSGLSFDIGPETIIDSEKRKIRAYQNKQLDLTAEFELINHPFVLVRAQCIDYPEIAAELTLPVHFNGRYKFDFSGYHGNSGRAGITPGHPNNFRYGPVINEPREPIINGSDGLDGVDGDPGENGQHGQNGIDMQVFVSLVDCRYERKQLVKIEVNPYNGEAYTRYLEKEGLIFIKSIGGNGGSGGHGGSGSDGLNGEKGAFLYHPVTKERISTFSGYGGNGGNGGFGGHGGNAGNGGDGGDISIFIEKEAWFFKDQIVVQNQGGKAGAPGLNGFGGQAGTGGEGGEGNGKHGTPGRDGRKGDEGQDGNKGEINYFILD